MGLARKVGAACTAAGLLLAAAPAWAHTPGLMREDLMSGFAHPFTGVDHMLAMVAIGIWAAMPGGRRVWQLPLAFMGVMAAGGAIGIAGVPMFGVEQGIALSVLVLGLVVAVSTRMPAAASVALVAGFALFHGHAHGTEFAAGESFSAYAAGFLVATGILHAVGIETGLLLASRSAWVHRLAGSAVVVAGFALLVQSF